MIQRGLEGALVLSGAGDALHVPGFVRFGGGAVNFPWRSGAMWIAEQSAPIWGVRGTEAQLAAQDAFRTDLYRQAMASSDSELPAASSKIEGSLTATTTAPGTTGGIVLEADCFFDGRVFDFDA